MIGSFRLLHVDDDPEFADLTATFLERESDLLEVMTETSVTDALGTLGESAFDCVVSDYDMPELNGIEFLERVRVAYPDIPFILFTGKGSETVASEAISSGASDYLQKRPGIERYQLLANRALTLAEKYRADQRAQRRRERRREQRAVLGDLATDEAVIDGDFEAAVERITELAADVLDVSRINVWLREDDDRLVCVDNYDPSADDHSDGMVLDREAYPAYFDALERHRLTDTTDPANDPRTFDFADDYLGENGITALLDATLRSRGEVIGVLCHESTAEGREWADDEIQFAGNLADQIHRAHRNRERRLNREEIEFQWSLLAANLDVIPYGIVVVDPDDTVISYNSRFLDIWGIDEAAVDGADAESVLRRIRARMATSGGWNLGELLVDDDGTTTRARITTKDGRRLDCYTAPVVGDDGTRFGRVWTCRVIATDEPSADRP
ncbi:response regulator [Halobaculum gomorrense]|uniref:PAS domain-containing protein n=1 Tax=Halobaculum gomorrense TaxID=43928 RepID=A0A1M5NNN4_9EURY|nr:response regulator [Halobaculum gomorrense]SHG91130.1 PAS domain-containing protein [Halobaculum gomorrense]